VLNDHFIEDEGTREKGREREGGRKRERERGGRKGEKAEDI